MRELTSADLGRRVAATRWRRRCLVVAAVALAVAEMALLTRFATREIVGGLPAGFDQTYRRDADRRRRPRRRAGRGRARRRRVRPRSRTHGVVAHATYEHLYPERAHPRAEIAGLVAVYDQVIEDARRRAGSLPRGFSAFVVDEYLNATVEAFLAYARHGAQLALSQEVAGTLFARSLAESKAGIDRSAYVVTTAARPADIFLYPGDRALQPRSPS